MSEKEIIYQVIKLAIKRTYEMSEKFYDTFDEEVKINSYNDLSDFFVALMLASKENLVPKNIKGVDRLEATEPLINFFRGVLLGVSLGEVMAKSNIKLSAYIESIKEIELCKS